ncbi:MAG: hypothetical protein LiPW30_206 [Parcubacteria group bacterium LiPW_30]|nr:MAG: hypothetical protein LiPW30_206 [Parcubacteria group bacterium LiPW_30]
MNSQLVRSFFQNKKLVGASILGISIIVLSLFSRYEDNKSPIINTTEEEQSVLVINGGADSSSVADLINKDSDKDGLKDWEEALYGTDPEKQDSNDNGITDSIEVRKQNDSKVPTKENINTTDQFGQQFFVAVSALKNTGQLSAQSIKNATETIYSNVKQEKISPSYTMNDISVLKNASDAEILAYGKTLGAVIQKYSKYNLGQELPLISTALETGDKTLPKKLIPYIDAYTNITKETLKIPVPDKIATIHLDLINSYKGTADSLKIAGKIFEDPLLSMQGINQYLSFSNKIIETAKTLEIYFKSGVILNSTKP